MNTGTQFFMVIKQGFFPGGGYNLYLPSIKRLQKPAIKVVRLSGEKQGSIGLRGIFSI